MADDAKEVRVLVKHVAVGDGATMTITDPASYADGGPEWVARYGNVASPVRYQIASLIESYDYLLSGNITMTEATRRLRLMRAARNNGIQKAHSDG